MSLNYRLLHPEEWSKLNDIVPVELIPAPEAAAVAVAETETGEILGVLFLQLQLHLEPLVIKSAAVNFKRLHAVLHDTIKDRKGLCYWSMTQNPIVAKMAESVGMQPVEDRLYKKEIT